MTEVADITCAWSSIDDMPRALRSMAVAVPEGYAVQIGGLKSRDLLLLARRIERAEPMVVVREVPKRLSGVEGILYAAFLAMTVCVWVFDFLPAMARVILRALS